MGWKHAAIGIATIATAGGAFFVTQGGGSHHPTGPVDPAAHVVKITPSIPAHTLLCVRPIEPTPTGCETTPPASDRTYA